MKIGDRVRFVRGAAPAWEPLIGREGRIVGLGNNPGYVIDFRWDCHVNFGEPDSGVNCLFAELEPITDPKAEQFIERIKKLAREPAPRDVVLTENRSEEK